MKTKKLIMGFFTLVMTLPAIAQIDNGSITAFQDGTPAVAAEVNANFQALLEGVNALADRVASLESGGSDSEGIGGTYSISGMGAATDCSDTSIAITLIGISGTATASDGMLTLNITEKTMDPIIRDDGVGNFEVVARGNTRSDTSEIPYDANGVISGIDAGAFTLSNSSAGCGGDITFITGVRN